MDYYSKDLQELINKDKVNVLRTPQGVFDAQIKAWDGLIADARRGSLHEEGDGLAEGLGARASCYYNMINATDYKRRLRPSLPGRAEDLIGACGS